jgi:hypothetical protein
MRVPFSLGKLRKKRFFSAYIDCYVNCYVTKKLATNLRRIFKQVILVKLDYIHAKCVEIVRIYGRIFCKKHYKIKRPNDKCPIKVTEVFFL